MDKIQRAIVELSGEGVLSHFMSKAQRVTLGVLVKGEEGEGFADIVLGLAERIVNMPKTYETDGQGEDAVAHLHYFHGSMDFYISEKDRGDITPDTRQHQAFGLADMGYPELGYVSIQELIDSGIELDLYWTPKPLKECYK
jgi:hypothetical protein